MLMNKDKTIYLGIDGGGSKTKAILVNGDNETLATGISGPSNPFHGFTQATVSIVDSAKMALKNADLPIDMLSHIVAGVGLAGVNLPTLYKQMQQWSHPFKAMHLTTDLRIACLGAHQGNDGAVIITGTGSCGYRCIGNEELIIGGHGFPHGDIGSGAWFGLAVVQQVLLSLDGLIQTTILTDMLLNTLKVKNDLELVEAIAQQPAIFYGSIANLVFDAAEQEDEIALKIVKKGSAYLSDIATKLIHDGSIRLSLIGGLTSRITPWLATDMQKKLSKPLTTPEFGAIFYARQHYAQKNKADVYSVD